MVKLFYTTYISIDLAYREIFRAKVGKGGINSETTRKFLNTDKTSTLGLQKKPTQNIKAFLHRYHILYISANCASCYSRDCHFEG